MKEYYGPDQLDWSCFPDNREPHACGSYPFVPAFDKDYLHSCGGYCQHKRPEHTSFTKNIAYPFSKYWQKQRNEMCKAKREYFHGMGGDYKIVWVVLLALFLCACFMWQQNSNAVVLGNPWRNF